MDEATARLHRNPQTLAALRAAEANLASAVEVQLDAETGKPLRNAP